MDPAVASVIDRCESITLTALDQSAGLQTRKDRKYVIPGRCLGALLDELPADVRALEIDGRRWFGYRSVYFDTRRFDSYRLAATRRPHRFKVRTRTYLDSGVTMAEVKTKNRRGRTVKRRRELDDALAPADDTIREFASQFAETAPYADRLEPVLTSQYRRATLVLPDAGVRITIDASYRCTDAAGRTTGLDRDFIVETKTGGAPSVVDRLLWRAGHRPKKISKYATGLAALHPELPANRWNPVLRNHFGRTSSLHRAPHPPNRPSRKKQPMTSKKRPTIVGATAVLAAVLLIAGCGTTSNQADTDAVAAATQSSEVGSDAAPATGDGAGTTSGETLTVALQNQESHFDADDLDYDQSDVVNISLDDTSATAESADVTVDGGTITITGGGPYSLAGTLADGEIVVDAADSEDVTLILDGVDITNPDGAAIAVLNAAEAVVLLADGASNRLTDGSTYAFPDAETDEPNATLYSAVDLTIAGDGEVVVNANYNDGITSKDGLAIESGTISVVAVDDGIRGKDYVIVEAGTIDVDAGGDGIKADNDEDADRGYVLISGGTVNATAGDDGVQAATDVLVAGGELTIDAGSGSDAGRAVQGDVMVVVSGGVLDATAVDDAIHSNNEVTIDGGAVTLASGDDGIHGDHLVTIDGGSITITDAYEGIESEVIYINDGFVDITSSDDGLNVASAEAGATTTADDAAVQAVPGEEAGTTRPGPGARGPGGGDGDAGVGEHYIYINGGTTVITITGDLAEQGDGIDANGHVEMTGGVVAVSGPTDTRNSAIDYSGGTFVMTGGTFIGTNIDGRNSEGIGAGSSQASLYLTPGSTTEAETVVHIEAADGQSLVTFEPVNDYSVIVFSSPDLVDGASYDVYLGGVVSGDSQTNLYEASAYTPGELVGTVTAGLSG